MRAAARLRVEALCRVVVLAARPPFSLRPDRAGTVWLVGSAAGPLGGDDLVLRVEVGEGARVAVRSVAAQVVLPGPSGAPARVRIEAEVAAGGHLDWCPEPTVVAAGADLHQTSVVELAKGATLRWQEGVVLGRHGEEPGRVTSRLDVDLAGRPLLRHGFASDVDGPAGLAGARAVVSELRAGGGAGDAALRAGSCRGDEVVVLPLDGDGVLTMAAGPDARTALSLHHGVTASMV
jgi:urease accessory protein